jgi:hypothetical protein
MTGFADQLMIRYLDPANVEALLVPHDDVDRQRVRALLAEVYEPGQPEVRSVDAIAVTGKRFQVPVTGPLMVRGTWEKVLPHLEHARASVELPSMAPTQWIDMDLETVISVRGELLDGALNAVSAEAVPAAPGQNASEFSQRYQLSFAEPPPFDPSAPGRKCPLRVLVLFFPIVDLEAALRRLVEARRAVDALRPRADEPEDGPLLGTCAWMAVFPSGALDPQAAPVTPDQVSNLFAAAGCVAAFETVG